MKAIITLLLLGIVLCSTGQESGYKYFIKIGKRAITVLPEPEPEPEPETYYYVRPVGTTYGTGDGTSYANAWSGFAAVNQALVAGAGAKLMVCGEHREGFTITVNNLYVRGDYATDSGWINGQGVRGQGVGINGRTNVTLEWLKVTHHTVQNIMIGSDNGTGSFTNIVTLNCDVSNSGNQGIQHWAIAGSTASHYNLKGNDCADEAISIHQDPTVNVYGGQFRRNADAAFNTIDGSIVNIYNLIDCENNGPVGLGRDLNIGKGAVTVQTAVANVYNSRVRGFATTLYGEINFTDSYVQRFNNSTGNDDLVGRVRFDRCMVDASGVTAASQSFMDMQSGSVFGAKYTIFLGATGTKNFFQLRSGVTCEYITNCVFYGNAGAGNVFFAQIATTFYNCIFRGLNAINTGTINPTWRHCSFSGNTSAPTGTQVNSVNLDPLFTNPAGLDFSLQAGSPMISAGEIHAGFETGINTANWGNATTIPAVVTRTQPTVWTIGAFIKD